MITKLNSSIDVNNEVNSLIDIKYANSIPNSKLIDKMIIILLVSKLEHRVETFSSNWFNKLKIDPKKTVSYFSENTIDEIIEETFEELENDFSRRKISKDKKTKYYNLNIAFDKNIPLSRVDIDFKITLGSHKKKEMIRLFKKLGVDNIFTEMEKMLPQNNGKYAYSSLKISTGYDLEGIYDHLINIRNRIIHEDDDAVISDQDFSNYIELVNLFDEYMTNFI